MASKIRRATTEAGGGLGLANRRAGGSAGSSSEGPPLNASAEELRGEEELRGDDEGAPEDDGDSSLIYEDAE